ncbi:MAG: hypothetical protein Dbin4_01738, partial [Alphaproteobacteria bacterium]|nr:hypothetical protein [Alphaproteobacteria bacterium]
VLLPLSAASALTSSMVELHPGSAPPPFHNNLWYMIDDAGQMTADQALADPERFQRNQTRQINLGIMGAVIWLRLDVVNAGAGAGEWLLNTLLRSAEILDIYLLDDAGRRLLFSNANADAALQNYDMLAAKFRLEAGKRATLYIRYHAQNVTRLPLRIDTFETLAAQKQTDYVLFTITAASVATFAVYSTAIFLLIGGPAILYYAIAETAMVLLLAQFDGILGLNFGPYTQLARLVAPAVFCGASIIFTALFARNFFPLREKAPWADLFFRLIIIAGFIYLGATALTVNRPELFDQVQISPYLMLAALWLALPPLAVWATWRWSTSFWPLVPGLTSVLLAHGYWILIVQNLVPEPPFQPRLLGLNFVAQGFFMAIAVVLRIRQLRDERLRALQQQLDAAHKNAIMLREMADQARLVQAAGHDTRSILYGLRNLASSLKQNINPAKISEAAQEIDFLTDDLEAVFSTTIAGALSGGAENILALEYVPIERILSALQLIHGREMRDKGLRFKIYAGAHELATDSALLTRILGNLIGNACQHTERGGVLVAARRHANMLRIQVWDNGRGIERELLSRLLGADAGQQRGPGDAPGQGSGLQIAKSLALQLGGSIQACSLPGQGSRFELVLPVTALAPAPPARRLWILDDDPSNAQKLQAMATSLGVTSSTSSAAAWSQHPGIPASDIAMIDLHFGENMGGMKIAAQLATTLSRNNIFICTYDRGADMRAKLASFTGVILYQPVSPQTLEYALRRTL